MVLSMYEAEQLRKENADLKRELKALKAKENLSSIDTRQLDSVLKSCKRIFATLNNSKRSMVISNGTLNNLENFCKPTDKRFFATYEKTLNLFNRHGMDLLSVENDFRNIHHFLMYGMPKNDKK